MSSIRNTIFTDEEKLQQSSFDMTTTKLLDKIYGFVLNSPYFYDVNGNFKGHKLWLADLVIALKNNNDPERIQTIIDKWKETVVSVHNIESTIESEFFNLDKEWFDDLIKLPAVIKSENQDNFLVEAVRVKSPVYYNHYFFYDHQYGFLKTSLNIYKNSELIAECKPENAFFNGIANVLLISEKEFVTLSKKGITKWDAKNFSFLKSFRFKTNNQNHTYGYEFCNSTYSSIHNIIILISLAKDQTKYELYIFDLARWQFARIGALSSFRDITFLSSGEICAVDDKKAYLYELKYSDGWKVKPLQQMDLADFNFNDGIQLIAWPNENYLAALRFPCTLDLYKFDNNLLTLIKRYNHVSNVANKILPSGDLIYTGIDGLQILNPNHPENVQTLKSTSYDRIYVTPENEVCLFSQPSINNKSIYQRDMLFEFIDLKVTRDYFKEQTRKFMRDIFVDLSPKMPYEIMDLIGGYTDVHRFFKSDRKEVKEEANLNTNNNFKKMRLG